MNKVALILLGITLGLIFADIAEAEPIYLCTSKTYTRVYGQRYKPCANFEQKFKRALVWSILDSYRREKLPRSEAIRAARTYKCGWVEF